MTSVEVNATEDEVEPPPNHDSFSEDADAPDIAKEDTNATMTSKEDVAAAASVLSSGGQRVATPSSSAQVYFNERRDADREGGFQKSMDNCRSCDAKHISIDLRVPNSVCSVDDSPVSSSIAGPLIYRISLEDPVGGMPARSGELLMFDPLSGLMKPWTILVFTRGFYAIARNSGMVHSFAWSPFSILIEDRAKGTDESPRGIREDCGFSLSILPSDMGFVFGSNSRDPKRECREWIAAMAKTLRTYTKSLFPPFALSVEPVEGSPSTRSRIVAGYLLQEDRDGVVVVYCELQAHRNGKGHLVLYDSDRCQKWLSSITITGDTVLRLQEGVDCSCFIVSVLHFCARSVEERSLWYRALDNVKVKCRNCAPDPTQEDLQSFRAAVLERVVGLELHEAARRLGAAATRRPSVPTPLRFGGAQVTRSNTSDATQGNKLRRAPPRKRACSEQLRVRTKVPDTTPRELRPAAAPPPSATPIVSRSRSRSDAVAGIDDEGDVRIFVARSRTQSIGEEGKVVTPEPFAVSSRQCLSISPAKDLPSTVVRDDTEDFGMFHKPPSSAPGPGMHEPCPGALQRATDTALDRLQNDGILSLG